MSQAAEVADVAAVHLESLYPRWSRVVEAVVSRNVSAPVDVVEEACQVAWSRLHAHRDRVRPATALGWLCTTATREALRILQGHARRSEVPLEDELTLAAVIELPSRLPEPEQAIVLRERLAEVRALPDRQRRVVWLQAMGYDYAEIAAQTGDSRRTVERQLLRARRRLEGVGTAG
jgi:RNA polymerase sigma factor (sigma-70 family)